MRSDKWTEFWNVWRRMRSCERRQNSIIGGRPSLRNSNRSCSGGGLAGNTTSKHGWLIFISEKVELKEKTELCMIRIFSKFYTELCVCDLNQQISLVKMYLKSRRNYPPSCFLCWITISTFRAIIRRELKEFTDLNPGKSLKLNENILKWGLRMLPQIKLPEDLEVSFSIIWRRNFIYF